MKMKTKKLFFVILFIYVVSGVALSLMAIPDNKNPSIYSNDIAYDDKIDIPKSSDPERTPLDPGKIHKNATSVRRAFETINFTVNISAYQGVGGNFTEIELNFTGGLSNYFDMAPVVPVELYQNHSFEYTPPHNAPLGVCRVSFLIYNASGSKPNWIQLNNHTTYVNITILANVMVGFNSTGYNRGNFVQADLVLRDDIDKWDIYITNDLDGYETEEIKVGGQVYQIIHEIDEWFEEVAKPYYIRVNVSLGIMWHFSYHEFWVENFNPIIKVSTIKFTPSSVFRTDNCRVDLNVTDEEDKTNYYSVNVWMILEDPEGDMKAYNLTNNKDGSFKKSFNILSIKPAGEYKVNITAFDSDGGTDTYYTYLTVKNNPPVINNYTINDMSMNKSMRVLYGEDLVFKFDVDDVEGIAYITVALLNQNDEWYNITKAYYEEDFQITIRTIELVRGRWLVYVYVIDTDGKKVGLDFDYLMAPQEIIIVEDLLSIILPLLALVAGLGLGVLIGVGIGYKVKGRTLQTQPTPKKTAPPPKRKQTTKRMLDQQKSAQSKKGTGETQTKEKITPSKEPKKTPQRKIKRKL